MAELDSAGRQIAGLLVYNPGPGIYSRLERAIQAMPENVRVQEMRGLLKRYKEGVPGWELKATDLDSTIAGRDVVPREELLSAVRERSPVYTHSEAIFGGSPESVASGRFAGGAKGFASQRLGDGVSQGVTKYHGYGHGGDDYTELLLVQPGVNGTAFGTHWAERHPEAVAHARFDTHGDALRINELQSDLGLHNRKMREQDAEYQRVAQEEGRLGARRMGLKPGQMLPFPMEDAWADLLIKRLALEAARKGHRAIEVASPRAIADKVGGNIDNYEHFYGKVVPGALERLGRKMGGLVPDQARLSPEPTFTPHYGESARRMEFKTTDAMNDAIALADGWVGRQRGQRSVGYPFEEMVDAMALSNDYREQAAVMSRAQEVHDRMVRTAIDNGYPEEAARTLVARAMPGVMRDAENVASLRHARARLAALAREHTPPAATSAAPGRRYIMSDEMRRRLIQEGVGAAVATGVMSQQGDK